MKFLFKQFSYVAICSLTLVNTLMAQDSRYYDDSNNACPETKLITTRINSAQNGICSVDVEASKWNEIDGPAYTSTYQIPLSFNCLDLKWGDKITAKITYDFKIKKCESILGCLYSCDPKVIQVIQVHH